MVDGSTCQISVAGYWAGLSGRLFNLLVQPQWVVPILVVLVVVPWVCKGLPARRSLSALGVLLLLLYSLGLSPWGAHLSSQGLGRWVPADDGRPADAIVVLGRGGELRPSRVQVAAELWADQRAPLVFASGRGDAIEIGQMLTKAGLPVAAIDGEPCSATTQQNAEFTAARLQPLGIQRLILVTDPPHMARSLLTFRSLGFEVTPHPCPLPPSLDSQHQRFLVLREWVGLVSYGLMGRYSPRPSQAPGVALQAE